MRCMSAGSCHSTLGSSFRILLPPHGLRRQRSSNYSTEYALPKPESSAGTVQTPSLFLGVQLALTVATQSIQRAHRCQKRPSQVEQISGGQTSLLVRRSRTRTPLTSAIQDASGTLQVAHSAEKCRDRPNTKNSESGESASQISISQSLCAKTRELAARVGGHHLESSWRRSQNNRSRLLLTHDLKH